MENNRAFLTLLTVLLAIYLAASACSRQDNEETSKPKKVVVKIERPPRPAETPQPKEKQGAPKPKKTPQAKEEPQPAPKNTESASAATKGPQKYAQETQKPPKEPTKPRPEQQGGWYKVEEKDTLITIAGDPRVYSDPYKWTSLLKLNLDQLGSLGFKQGVEATELPVGTRIRYLTPEQVAQRRKQLQGRKWVVNILSDKSSRRISDLAIRLVKNDIPVYITRADIKGEQWLRLRTGFFASPDEAKQMKAKIEQIIGAKGLWLAKISDEEFDRYAGY